ALRSGDLVKVGGAIFKFLQGGNIETLYHEEIYQLTISDGLTQINNKRYFLEYLEREMGRCHRYNRSLSLIMFDIDHFKTINDTNGHLAGDYVLRELAQTLRPRIRREECFARYGGEEFAVVMPEAGPENARKFAEKVRKMVEDHRFSFENKDIPVTISLGVSDLTGDMTEPLQFIKLADQNLYKAKKSGRNRVVG
ncbi:MAG: GGDEF domain-containing protein, partial [Archangium sp.]|nr:GGDEF domain-containing protein [Archangium sp.]